MVSVHLPVEVWLLVCEVLETEKDFGALFKCVSVNKMVAAAAVKSLYRIHSDSPVMSEGSEIEQPKSLSSAEIKQRYATHVQQISKWALQWRSIIQSGLGIAMFPYCLYIKSLDLRNLKELFDNGIFLDNVQESFFTPELCSVIKKSGSVQDKRFGKSSLKRRSLKYNSNLCQMVIGEVITSRIHSCAVEANTKSALEEIAGEIPGGPLHSWCGRVEKLRMLTLWDGNSLSKAVALQLKQTCKNFTSLSVLTYLGDNADTNMAEFLNNLQPNSLTYFEIIGSNDIHEETFKALSSSHHETLSDLRLGSLKANAIRHLALLGNCNKLITLELEDRGGSIILEVTDKEVCDSIISWLMSCVELKNLTIKNMRSGGFIVKPILRNPNIHLHKFEMIKFVSDNVITVLALQQSLTHLKLQGEPVLKLGSLTISHDHKVVDCILAMPNLRFLDLIGVSEQFGQTYMLFIIERLKELRELSLSGHGVTDKLLIHLADLSHLQSLTLAADTHFTFAGLEAYIETLSPINNANFLLSIMSQALDAKIEEEKLEILAKKLKDKVGGRLDFVLFREDDDEFDGYETEMND